MFVTIKVGNANDIPYEHGIQHSNHQEHNVNYSDIPHHAFPNKQPWQSRLMYPHEFQQLGAHIRCLQMMSAQFRSEYASNEILGTLQQTQLSLENALGPLSLANDTVMVMSDDDASDQIEDDVEEDDTADRNNELHDDCEDDYIGGHEDHSEDDKVEQTDILDCNHADGGIGHTTTVVLEEVELDDHGRTIGLEDVEGADPIYENTITLENDIRSPDGSDQERENIGNFERCRRYTCVLSMVCNVGTELRARGPWATDLLNRQFNEACHFSIQAIVQVEFQVIGGTKDRMVNFSTKECSCGEFQSDLLPCTHAMAAISKCKRATIELCSDYYKTQSWEEGYAFVKLGILSLQMIFATHDVIVVVTRTTKQNDCCDWGTIKFKTQDVTAAVTSTTKQTECDTQDVHMDDKTFKSNGGDGGTSWGTMEEECEKPYSSDALPQSGWGKEDVIPSKTFDDSSKSNGWEQQKSPECYEGWGSLHESNQPASSNGWDTPNGLGSTKSEKQHQSRDNVETHVIGLQMLVRRIVL
ncbi:zinc finger protein [Theobroma cacao]|nr:zinc finger protein [Theobroma cacao]